MKSKSILLKTYLPSTYVLVDETDNRFDQLLCQRAYEADPNFRWCTNRNCSAGQLIVNGGTYLKPSNGAYQIYRSFFVYYLCNLQIQVVFQLSDPRSPSYVMRTIQSFPQPFHRGSKVKEMACRQCHALHRLWSMVPENKWMRPHDMCKADWLWCGVVLQMWRQL